MSCDSAARSGIAAICAAVQASGHLRPVGAQAAAEQAMDLPPTLRDGETREALQREARIFMGRLTQHGIKLPDHLDLDSPSSRTAIRWGRANIALREHGAGIGNERAAARWAAATQQHVDAAYAQLGRPVGMGVGDLPNGCTFPVAQGDGTVGLAADMPVALSGGLLGQVVAVEGRQHQFQRPDGTRFSDWAATVRLAQGGVVTVAAQDIEALEMPRRGAGFCGNCGYAREATGHRCWGTAQFRQIRHSLAVATRALMGSGDAAARRADLAPHLDLDEPDLRVRARAVLDYIDSESDTAHLDPHETDPVLRALDPSVAAGLIRQLEQAVYPMDGELDSVLRAWTAAPPPRPLSEGGPTPDDLTRLKQTAHTIRALPEHVVPHDLFVAAGYLISTNPQPTDEAARGWALASALGYADTKLSGLHEVRKLLIDVGRRRPVV